MKRFLLICFLCLASFFCKAQFRFVANVGKPNFSYFSLFVGKSGKMVMYYGSYSSESFEPYRCESNGIKEILGKKLVSFVSPFLYGGKEFYLSFNSNLTECEVFDSDMRPVGVYTNDSKYYKGTLNLK